MPGNPPGGSPATSKKKRKNKGRRQRRQSFAGVPDEPAQDLSSNPNALYMQQNGSNTSLDSETLLDHREQRPALARPRRTSTQMSSSFHLPQQQSRNRLGTVHQSGENGVGDDDGVEHETAPLLSSSAKLSSNNGSATRGYGSNDGRSRKAHRDRSRPDSGRSGHLNNNPWTPTERYNVNFPPSMPGSPTLGSSDRLLDLSFGDALMRDEFVGPSSRANSMTDLGADSQPDHPPFDRRHTIALHAEEDVCFPQEGMSELGDEELPSTQGEHVRRRRKQKKWPDLAVLDEWYRLEKEGRSEGRTKKITEPQLVDGRLRPIRKGFFRSEEEMPYRFTYFNEEVQSTIHSATISELVQPEGSFKDLFMPDPPILPDSSEESSDDEPTTQVSESARNGDPGSSRAPTRQPSLSAANTVSERPNLSPGQTPVQSSDPSRNNSGGATPVRPKSPISRMRSPQFIPPKEPRYGDRPVWWLDVLSPTEQEMKYISKAFGIHPLTSEDIMLQEQREKVELFKHYYFVNYRTFDQDEQSENHLEPINMYVVVFREGVISFHFSQTPHPANVRRRIRQLKDFMVLSADWISYAIIDDITDVYLPLIQAIEDEVDEIDDKILELHSSSDPATKEKQSADEKEKSADAHQGGDMLRRVGDCRKKVMRLFRLLGNKADVIKGFAKRCNENWDVAPRSEIGLYLGDIQDHIVTMTGNLGHYEAILARCHSSYIAQINIKMNERQEATASGLNSLTILGTIVLPMNIVTGLWGMNVWVPGQEFEGDLTWFFAITAGLLLFGLACYWMAKAVYKIG